MRPHGPSTVKPTPITWLLSSPTFCVTSILLFTSRRKPTHLLDACDMLGYQEEATSELPTTPICHKPPPQLPLDIIHQIYSNFDPINSYEDRDMLASSLRVSKSFHNVVARHLYREVALHWPVNNEYRWKDTDSCQLPIPSGPAKNADWVTSPYRKYIRYLCVHDHVHRQLSHPPRGPAGKPSKVQILEVKMRTRGQQWWRGNNEKPKEKWCEPCAPGDPRDRRLRLTKCFALTPFKANTLILDCPFFFGEVSRAGMFGVPRFPDSTFKHTRRLVIRPTGCSNEPLSPRSRIRLGYIPRNVSRIDIVFEPGFWQTCRGKLPYGEPTQVAQVFKTWLLANLSEFLFTDSRGLLPESCEIYFVNMGEIDVLGDPGWPATAVQRTWEETLETQNAVREQVRKGAFQRYGETPNTISTVDRLRFQTFEEYAKQLKGINRRLISRRGWAHLYGEPYVEREV